MQTELKKDIFNWLCNNENTFCRVNHCKDAFRQYIYKADGSYCIGGGEVSKFINDADALI